MATTKKAQKSSTKPSLKVGEQVRWDSSGGSSEGRITKIATKSGSIKGFDYKATKDDPRYIVETDEGKQAAHKAEELRKV